MKPQAVHQILPRQTYDEATREICVSSMRKFFTTELIPANRVLYETRLLPKFEDEHGRAPQSADEVGALMNDTFYYRAASLVGRATQELLWDTVGESVERQIDDLNQCAHPKADDLGTVRTNPAMTMPDYIKAVDIHVMPGNFHTELSEDDVFAGALYDRGAYVFAYGSRGPYNDSLGVLVAALLKERFPDFKPRRILDMGCGAGASTLPLKRAWPDAEVYGVDVGAPMIRYGHARAESLGLPVHFSQQDANHTDFPDGHFDLVISILVNHEMPLEVVQENLRECHRLLSPGGIMLHDGRLKSDKGSSDPFQSFMGQWFASNINEPYGKGLDMERDFQAAGFAAEDTFSGSPEGDEYLKGQIAGHSFVGAIKR